jgi:hypothetical protein
LKKKFYFNPKFYNWNTNFRIVFSPKFNITLKLNFDFSKLNVEYLFFILSVLQLNVLGIITDDATDDYLSHFVGSYMSLSYRRVKKSFTQRLIRKVNGKVVEEVMVELTSEEFEREIKSGIFFSRFSTNIRGKPRVNRITPNDSS